MKRDDFFYFVELQLSRLYRTIKMRGFMPRKEFTQQGKKGEKLDIEANKQFSLMDRQTEGPQSAGWNTMQNFYMVSFQTQK